MKQHRMRQVSYDTEVGKITKDYRVLGRETANLVVGIHDGFSMRCSLDVGYPKDDGKELDMIRSDGVFFVAARPSKWSSKKGNTLELNLVTAETGERQTRRDGQQTLKHTSWMA